jgi:leucyl aminopeptidase
MSNLRIAQSLEDEYIVIGLQEIDGALEVVQSGHVVDTQKFLPLVSKLGLHGGAEEVMQIPVDDRIIVTTGLGKAHPTGDPESLRRAAGSAARALVGKKSASFAIGYKTIEEFAAISEGAALGAYEFNDFKSKSEQKEPLSDIAIHCPSPTPEHQEKLSRAQIIAENIAFIRDLINTPPSHLTPESFSLKARKAAVNLGLKVEILTESMLKRRGYGGLIAVGQGSANPPRLLHISYAPVLKRKKNLKRIALVGKGITFDTGGLALKPAQGMEEMKSDMSGAAAAVAVALSAAQLKLNIKVDAWAALAENMVSDKATRPSDIITIYGGKTVEVLNPDAEGRLVLADALVRAAESAKDGLDGIIDIATLTGAQVVALGTRTAAVMTNNEEFSSAFLKAAEKSGEKFWPMPLPQELRASLDSPVADIANIGERMGGMLVAGLFLREFVAPELPWLHLDIAGPAFNADKAYGYTPVGGTGVALRSLITLLEALSSAQA